MILTLLAGAWAGRALAQDAPAPSAADPSRCKIGVQAQIEDCDASLAQSADPKTRAQRLFVRAYLKNDRQLYESAITDLDEALRLDPDHPEYLHERGYTLGALGRYEEAIRDLDAQVKQQPDQANGYTERAFSELPLARFDDLWRDRNKAVELSPGDGEALIGRARAAMWLGRFEDARNDVNAAAEMAKTQTEGTLQKDADDFSGVLTRWATPSGAADPDKRCRDVWEAVKTDGRAFAEPNLIGDCTAAYFKAATPKAKAELLTIRSVAWQVVPDDAAATDDATIAVALDPDNSDLHLNLGFLYLGERHSWAAEKQFDMAIAKKPDDMNYAGRAQARLNQGKYDDAFADAKKSFELKPNQLSLSVLGDLAWFVRHDAKSAKLYWMGAWSLGEHDDSLRERLKLVGVDDPAKEPADPPAKR
ncbi:MAG TPA: tetratricopeptide repeat protein [Caulobacteraceae bacterium]